MWSMRSSLKGVQMADAGVEGFLNKRSGQLHRSIQDKSGGCFREALSISRLLIESCPLHALNDLPTNAPLRPEAG
jgi:hypothetical protein